MGTAVGQGGAEEERLEALVALQVLDTPPEAEFDFITSLAAQVFGVRSPR